MISHKHSQPNFKFGSWCFEKNIYNVLSYSRKNGKKKYNRITISNKKKYIFSFQATIKYWLISPNLHVRYYKIEGKKKIKNNWIWLIALYMHENIFFLKILYRSARKLQKENCYSNNQINISFWKIVIIHAYRSRISSCMYEL